MVDLTICLLCSGKGAEAQSYRPNLDESQWWGRRDALVRCVAASLYGPRNTKQKRPDRVELCLLFDEDGCVMRMQSPPLGLNRDDCPVREKLCLCGDLPHPRLDDRANHLVSVAQQLQLMQV